MLRSSVAIDEPCPAGTPLPTRFAGHLPLKGKAFGHRVSPTNQNMNVTDPSGNSCVGPGENPGPKPWDTAAGHRVRQECR